MLLGGKESCTDARMLVQIASEQRKAMHDSAYAIEL
jgi:hypothetical protein